MAYGFSCFKGLACVLLGICRSELLQLTGCSWGELLPSGVRNLCLGYQGFCIAVLKKNCFFF